MMLSDDVCLSVCRIHRA